MANLLSSDPKRTENESLSTRRLTRVAVAGVSGYAGAELARLLLGHPKFGSNLPLLLGRPEEESSIECLSLAELHPHLAVSDDVMVLPFNWKRLEEQEIELLILATPHDQSRLWVPEALARGIRVIDLSGAWRLKRSRNRDVYRFRDEGSPEAGKLQKEAVYGCPELYKDAIRSAALVANPGCYATSVILALAPLVSSGLVDLDQGIICDAKSGVSGAGKAPAPGTHFMYVADNLSAYSVFSHRHMGELLEQLHLRKEQIQFTPHLLPIPRGILSTIYLRLKQPADPEKMIGIMQEFFVGSPFVRVRRPGLLPQIQHVVHTNFCDLGLVMDEDGKRMIIISCLDNLLKGAAGQAVQNLNLMCGWGEMEGLL